MIYGSVCSGIEAASVAWKPLGWTPAFFSEIDKFPSAVLAHHYGSNMPGNPIPSNGVPNLGDMTKFQEWPDYAIDLLVGGTPCQTFSVAGLRQGLADPRGNLMLTYGAVAQRYRPKWIVWENVPGVLSSNGGRDFGTFLGLLGQLGYGFAYRVLDAQFVRVDGFERAVPQRRRRVFVVGYLGDWRRAAAVLFDPEGLSRDLAPRREARKDVAATVTASTGGCSGKDGLEGRLIETVDTVGVSPAIKARDSKGPSSDGDGDGAPILPVCFNSREDPEVTFDRAGSISAGLPQSQAIAIQERTVSENPDAGPGGAGVRQDGASYTHEARTTAQAVAFKPSHYTRGKDGAPSEVFPPLSADADRGDQEAVVAYGFEDRARGDDGRGYDRAPHFSEDVSPTAGTVKPPSVAYDLRGRDDGSQFEGPHDTANVRAASGGSSRSYVAEQWAVRRLTPTETARLQGFPDDYTRIPWRGKPADQCPDGPQYKAHGNSMAVPVMRWIGRRIQMIEELANE